jgi:choline-sulfatase
MPFRRLLGLFLFLAFGPLLAFAAAPNIILITVDTTRADRMGFLGSQRGLTPNLDALAHDSVIFTHAYSQVPLTTASHATILSGTYPQFHGVNDAGVALGKDVPYAPAILRLHGYKTAAFVGAVILDPRAGGAPGFDRGFDVYDAGFHSMRRGEDRYHSVERRGAEVVDHATTWLKRQPHAPFFLWVHLYDPHSPYDPPEPFRSKYSTDLYDGEIAYTDSVIGKLLDQLRSSHLYDRAVIAVMADHGEALGENGERGHGIFLYDPTIHVPLLVKLPGHHAGEHIDETVELVDVMPTLLRIAGIAPPTAVQGKSLLPLLSDKHGAVSSEAYAETDYPHTQFGWSSLRSLRKDKYLFIDAPRKELYDRKTDPRAEHNLATNSPAVTSTFSAELDKFRSRTASATGARKPQLDAAQAQRLRALGYLASSDQSTASTAVGGIDPKDKIEIANQMTDANLAMEEGAYQQATTKLQNIIAMDASFAPAYSALGTIYSDAGDIKHAIPLLQRAVELRPESVSAHYGLGMAFFQAGDFEAAAPQFEAAVARDSKSAAMHYSLASVYVRINRMEDARKQLERSIALKPDFFDANLMLGQVFVVEKKPSLALPYLQKAARLQPARPEPHVQLANAYTQLGQKQKADRERALASGGTRK